MLRPSLTHVNKYELDWNMNIIYLHFMDRLAGVCVKYCCCCRCRRCCRRCPRRRLQFPPKTQFINYNKLVGGWTTVAACCCLLLLLLLARSHQ